MPKSARRQFLVQIAGISGTWATKTGGEITADTTKVYDGGSLQPETLAGPAQSSNVVVTRAYDYARDAALLKRLGQQVGRFRSTLSVTPTDQNMIALGQPRIYPNALLVGLTDPEPDASSGDAGTLQLEFAVGAWQ